MSARGRGADPNVRRARRFQREFLAEARKLYSGHIVVASRRSQIDVGQLTPKAEPDGMIGDVQLRILDSDVDGSYIVTGDVGKFWFVVGYSAVGGPDIPRP